MNRRARTGSHRAWQGRGEFDQMAVRAFSLSTNSRCNAKE